MSITKTITMTMIKIMIDKKMMTTTMIIALQNVEDIGQSLNTISLSLGVIYARGES